MLLSFVRSDLLLICIDNVSTSHTRERMHIHRAGLGCLVQDFKEAARLSAESKARAAEAEAASARAAELRGRAAGLESEEAALAGDAARLQGELLAAKRVLALAKWRRLKVGARMLHAVLPSL